MNDQLADPVVLLVDDDEMERVLHRQTPDPVGREIVEAEDGITALGAFAITMADIVVLAPPVPSGCGNQDAFLTELRVARADYAGGGPRRAERRGKAWHERGCQ